MLRDKIRAAWEAPRAPDAPSRVWRDWALVATIAVVGLAELVFRSNLVWPGLSVLFLILVAAATLWRRSAPLLSLLLVWVPMSPVNAYALAVGRYWETPFTFAALLILLYALTRWGSGREILLGIGPVLVASTLGILSEEELLTSELVGGYLVVFATFEIGFIVRAQVRSRVQAIAQTKLEEREQLARELHDTVAHHVSAIAIQAQAGRTLAATNPAAAVDALTTIEEEASRTLVEMRAMVGTLRDGEEAEYRPQPGVADIEGLAEVGGTDVRVDVELTGDLDQLRPAVDTALFRLAQESVTNAIRHARNATRVAIRVTGGDKAVRLTVADDGDSGSAAWPGVDGSDYNAGYNSGYGLIGMRERADLLGGTLQAGPQPERGWTVEAVLPRQGEPA